MAHILTQPVAHLMTLFWARLCAGMSHSNTETGSATHMTAHGTYLDTARGTPHDIFLGPSLCWDALLKHRNWVCDTHMTSHGTYLDIASGTPHDTFLGPSLCRDALLKQRNWLCNTHDSSGAYIDKKPVTHLMTLCGPVSVP